MRPGWTILYVSDLERSIRFYRDVVGLELRFSEHGYAELTLEGDKLGLFERSRLPGLIGREATEGGPGGEVLFLVPDADSVAKRLEVAGAEILSGPTDRPWGHRTVHVPDPDGFVVEFAQEIPRTRPRS